MREMTRLEEARERKKKKRERERALIGKEIMRVKKRSERKRKWQKTEGRYVDEREITKQKEMGDRK